MNQGPPLSPQVFVILSILIEEKLGLFFGPDYRDLLAEKLGPRAAERGLESMLDYYYFLRYDPEAEREFLALADALTINETYFLREAAQLNVLVDEVLSPAVRAGQRPRVWCAACSTGEEPLTLAGLLDERGILAGVDVVASDVSARVLQIASRGVYGSRSVRSLATMPDWLRSEDERHVVADRLRLAIGWRRINLLDDIAVRGLGSFDVIVCRNVLIYFRDATTEAVVSRLHGTLKPGGLLLVGASESLLRLGTAFVCEERGGSFFYRKVPQ